MAGKPNFEEFPAFARSELGFDPASDVLQTWADTNTNSVLAQLQQHQIFARLQEFISSHQATSKKKAINIVGPNLELNLKSYQSIISKIYRLNIVRNARFPKNPKKGWVTPANMFGRLNDIVRTTIVCRHIDEPDRIANEIINLASSVNIDAKKWTETKDDGYYATHVYLQVPVRLVDQQWQQFDQPLSFEIQITTEMQHMLYELTHTFYDRERHLLSPDTKDWKWDYRSARFSASYLSHALHLLEGLILRLHEEIEPAEATKGMQLLGEVADGAELNEPQPSEDGPSATGLGVDQEGGVK